jgi:FkbM family methyltransferase
MNLYKTKYIKGKLTKNLSKRLIKDIFKNSKNFSLTKKKKFALYGMGSLGVDAIEYFKYNQKKVLLYVDKEKKFLKDIKILNPEDIKQETKKDFLLLVCVVNFSFTTIYKELKKDGWKNIIHFYDYIDLLKTKHPLNNGWSIEKFNKQDRKNIKSIINNFWSDTYSLKHYLQFLAWKKLKQEWFFDKAPVNSKNRFFIDKILSKLSNEEYYLDIGSHHCQVAKKFLDLTKNKFKKIILIEPDRNNFDYIKDFIKNKKIKKKVKFYKDVISNENKKINFFEGLNFSSQISKYGNKKLITKKIDNLELSPTFMKIHIEGNELNALKGSIKTIVKFRPKIVFTAYHNSEIIWKIPLWLKKNLKDYKFFFRLHSWCGSGAVVYCIPK